ncbi:hypothetical protein FOA43_000720 [Brettanomyces nanus]|uniref:Uncharacterized protein n=1 Tax=Eeniella nana TaxID=13502 RepID=A0A875RNB1_EENNA|nr:uncharacterized protein FOA43_000720 [Brettanomyces nanus]QPG73410.1 hypothetical protein FOA43_000720 [Brettanomyces nanus]
MSRAAHNSKNHPKQQQPHQQQQQSQQQQQQHQHQHQQSHPENNISTTINDTTGTFTVLSTTGHSSSSSSYGGRKTNSTGIGSSESDNTNSTSTSTTDSTNRTRKSRERFVRDSQRYSLGLFKEGSISAGSYGNSSILLNSLYGTTGMTGINSGAFRIYDDSETTSRSGDVRNSGHSGSLDAGDLHSNTSTSHSRFETSEVSTIAMTNTRLVDPMNPMNPMDPVDREVENPVMDTANLITEEELSDAMRQPSMVIRTTPELQEKPSLCGYSFSLGNVSSASSSADTANESIPTPELATGPGLRKSTPGISHYLLTQEEVHNASGVAPFEQKSFRLTSSRGSESSQEDSGRHDILGSLLLMNDATKKSDIKGRNEYIQQFSKAHLEGKNSDESGNSKSPKICSPTSYDASNDGDDGSQHHMLLGEKKGTQSGNSSDTQYNISAHHALRYSPLDPEKSRSSTTECICPNSIAIVMILISVLAPPFWILIAAGYADNAFGSVPRVYKLISAALAILIAIAAIIGICVGFGYGLTH